MPHIETPWGIRLRYEQRGPADARPIVLAHGFGVGLEMWLPQSRALAERHRLVTWDIRGHGGSSAPERIESYTMPSLAADLRALLEALDIAEGAVIGGVSFGGMIALQYAVDLAPTLHALVLSDTVTRGRVGYARPLVSSAFEEWAGDPGLEGGMYGIRTRPDLTPRLAEVTVPTLVLAGTDDHPLIDDLDRLVDGLPRRRVVRLEGCGHGTPELRPRTWNECVLEFLDDLDRDAALGEDLRR